MKNKTVLRLIALIGLTYCSISVASPVDDAWNYYDQADFNKAAETFRALKPIPVQGLAALCGMAVTKKSFSDAKADLQYCIDGVAANDPYVITVFGLANLYGNEWLQLAKNPKLGLGYLGKAAINDFPLAYEVLCNYFYQDSQFGRAAPFCKVAAANNMSGGLYHLALMSLNGKGTVQDFEKGRNFAQLSASLNNFNAYMLLGSMSKSGTYGQPKDLVAAYAWYALAGATAPDSDEPQQESKALGLDSVKVSEAQKIAGKWQKSASQKWREMYKAASVIVAQAPATSTVTASATGLTSASKSAENKTSAPSFDCTKITSEVEKLICSDSDLSKLDVELSNKYSNARKSSSDKKQVRDEQLVWMKTSRNSCSDKQCLATAYKQRISDLNGLNK